MLKNKRRDISQWSRGIEKNAGTVKNFRDMCWGRGESLLKWGKKNLTGGGGKGGGGKRGEFGGGGKLRAQFYTYPGQKFWPSLSTPSGNFFRRRSGGNENHAWGGRKKKPTGEKRGRKPQK